MVTTHFGLVSGLFWAPRDTKRARFGPKCPFLGSQRSSEGPQGTDLVHTAADWPDWVEIMVATHFGLVSGLFWASRDTKRARFGPKCPFLGSSRLMGQRELRTRCCPERPQMTFKHFIHEYKSCWPSMGPFQVPTWGPKGPK